MSFKDEGKWLLETSVKKAGSLAELSREIGASIASLSRWRVDMGSATFKSVANMADFCRVHLHFPEEENVFVRISGSDGTTYGDLIVREAMVQNSFFEKMDISPSDCVLLEVADDSMSPTVLPGDSVLLHTFDRHLIDGKLYLVAVNGKVMLRRAFLNAANDVLLRSDNPVFPEVHITPDKISSLEIYGRIRWLGKVL
ncbi:MAG: S24 family peptidase [Desulfovibrio sp.]|nr:S24 family peptidase [Desulfovibrio sp.]